MYIFMFNSYFRILFVSNKLNMNYIHFSIKNIFNTKFNSIVSKFIKRKKLMEYSEFDLELKKYSGI